MIEVDIATPTKKLLTGVSTTELKLPTAKGEITVLPGHRELLTLLGTGILSFPQDGRERKFAISYGFAEIRNNRVLVLAETCEESVEIDRERAKKAKKRAEDALGAVLTEDQFRKYQLKLQRAIIRQHISER